MGTSGGTIVLTCGRAPRRADCSRVQGRGASIEWFRIDRGLFSKDVRAACHDDSELQDLGVDEKPPPKRRTSAIITGTNRSNAVVVTAKRMPGFFLSASVVVDRAVQPSDESGVSTARQRPRP